MYSGDLFVCFCQSWSLKRHGSLEEGRHGAGVEGGSQGQCDTWLGWAGLSLAGLGWASLGFYWVPYVCYCSRLFI